MTFYISEPNIASNFQIYHNEALETLHFRLKRRHHLLLLSTKHVHFWAMFGSRNLDNVAINFEKVYIFLKDNFSASFSAGVTC